MMNLLTRLHEKSLRVKAAIFKQRANRALGKNTGNTEAYNQNMEKMRRADQQIQRDAYRLHMKHLDKESRK